MSKTWIKNALIINEGRKYIGSVLIHQDKIHRTKSKPYMKANARKKQR